MYLPLTYSYPCVFGSKTRKGKSLPLTSIIVKVNTIGIKGTIVTIVITELTFETIIRIRKEPNEPLNKKSDDSIHQ